MTIANAKPDLLITGPIGTSMVNAASSAWHDYLTVEAKITAAIAYAVSIGAKYCYVPDSFLPYTASLVTFNPAVKMTREGGGTIGWDLKAYGAAANGTANDTASFVAAVAAASAANGGIIWMANSTAAYTVTSSIIVNADYIQFVGEGWAPEKGGPSTPTTVNGDFDAPVFDVTGTRFGVQFINFSIGGGGAPRPNSIGIRAANLSEGYFERIQFDQTGGPALLIQAGAGGAMIDCFAENGCMARPAVDTGVFDIAATDFRAFGSFATASVTGLANLGNGHSFAWAVRGTNSFYMHCMAELSQHGWLITSGYSSFLGCRAFLNQGNGWVLSTAAGENTVVGCRAISNSQNANNGFAGFKVQGTGNLFDDCLIDGVVGDTNKQSNGFDDSNSNGASFVVGNRYGTNRIGPTVVGVLYNMTGNSPYNIANGHRLGIDRGDASITVQCDVDAETQFFNTPLTANRTCTLSVTGAWNGAQFRIVRTAAATGASTLTVQTPLGGNKVLAAGQWVDVEFDGLVAGAWRQTGFGSL
jgi:hypothetical protein